MGLPRLESCTNRSYLSETFKTANGHYNVNSRDVPDIRFRFLLAGYPAVFFYPVPAPVPAEMVPGTGYFYRIVQSEQTVVE